MPNKVSSIKNILWSVISEYIRRRDSDEYGIVKCCTCEIRKPWKEMQAGHFIPAAQGNSTRWDETNIHGQCMRCNCNLGGNGSEYYPFMLNKYGHEYVELLRQKAKINKPMKYHEYEELLKEYKLKLKKIIGE